MAKLNINTHKNTGPIITKSLGEIEAGTVFFVQSGATYLRVKDGVISLVNSAGVETFELILGNYAQFHGYREAKAATLDIEV